MLECLKFRSNLLIQWHVSSVLIGFAFYWFYTNVWILKVGLKLAQQRSVSPSDSFCISCVLYVCSFKNWAHLGPSRKTLANGLVHSCILGLPLLFSLLNGVDSLKHFSSIKQSALFLFFIYFKNKHFFP